MRPCRRGVAEVATSLTPETESSIVKLPAPTYSIELSCMAIMGICYVLPNVNSIHMMGHVTVRLSSFNASRIFTLHVVESHYSALLCSIAPYSTIHYVASLCSYCVKASGV